MPRDGDGKADEGLTQDEAMVESVIASLKWLGEACRRAGLEKYADVVEDAFQNGLQLYVNDLRDKLAGTFEEVPPPAFRRLN